MRSSTRMYAGLIAVVATVGVAACSTSGEKVSPGAQPSTHKSAAPAPGTPAPPDPRVVVAAENAKPGTISWQLPKAKWATDTELAGWVNHTSVLPGQSVRMFTTATVPTYTVSAYRMGDYAGKGGRLIWKSSLLRGVRQPSCPVRAHHMVDCSNWKQTAQISTTGWPAGLYLLKLDGSDGRSKYIPLTLRTRDLAGKLVLVSADATYQAYNQYGGYSLYAGK